MKNPNTIFTTILLAGFAFLPQTQGVIPPPDGGYPGFNTAEGQNALFNLTTGVGNTAVGWFSLWSDADGSYNTALGAGTLLFNIGDQSTGEGAQNTAIGTAALLFNTTGSANTATGVTALLNNSEGSANTANGWGALSHNNGNPPDGSANTAVGAGALFSNTTGDSNTAIGENALVNNTTGSSNTAVGVRALDHNTSGSLNVALGVNAGMNVVTAQNAICIGLNVFGADVGDSCFIGNIFGQTSALGAAVYVVEKVNPDLVVRDKEGKPYSVRYEQVNAMLLNEFLKEHKSVQELKAALAQQQKEIAALIAHIKEQDAKVQKISDQLEMSNAASQVASIK